MNRSNMQELKSALVEKSALYARAEKRSRVVANESNVRKTSSDSRGQDSRIAHQN